MITIGNNINPPSINMDITQNVYDCARSDEFDVERLNSLLAAVVVYLDVHEINYDDSALPWAEMVTEA